jgi:ubiquinone/menaquinone biosynthesis C-methylase UbiE
MSTPSRLVDSPADQSVQEFYKHQELLLPYTSRYLGKTNLDIGRGTGLTSVIHQKKLGISPTVCDVVDIRHAMARALAFFLTTGDTLPFEDESFDSSYIRYVLRHLQTSAAVARPSCRSAQSGAAIDNRGGG